MKDICLVIPLFNEEERIQKVSLFDNLDDFSDYIFVNDGSSDNTLEILEKECLKKENYNFVSYEENKGKSSAVQRGFQEAIKQNYKFIGFMDGDLATPVSELKRMFEVIQKDEKIQLVIGSRKKNPDSNIERKLSRIISTFFLSLFISILIRKRIYDTQCGAKIISHSLAKSIFANRFVSRWIFDIEILLRAKKELKTLDHSLVEVPLKKWSHQEGSKLAGSDFLKVPFEIIKILLS